MQHGCGAAEGCGSGRPWTCRNVSKTASWPSDVAAARLHAGDDRDAQHLHHCELDSRSTRPEEAARIGISTAVTRRLAAPESEHQAQRAVPSPHQCKAPATLPRPGPSKQGSLVKENERKIKPYSVVAAVAGSLWARSSAPVQTGKDAPFRGG